MQIFHRSFKGHIVLTYILFSFITVFSASFLFTLFNRLYTQRIHNEMSSVAAIISQNVDNFFDNPEGNLQEIEQKIDLYPDGGAILDNYIGNILEIIPSFENIFYMNSHGIVENIWPKNDDFIGADLSLQTFYVNSKKKGDVYWSDSFISYQSGLPTIALSTKTDNGVVAAFFKLSELNKFVNIKLNFNEEFIAILESRGEVIARTERLNGDPTVNLGYMNTFKSAKQGQFGTGVEYYKGTKGLVNVNPVPKSGFYVLVFRSYKHLVGELEKLYFIYLGILLCIVIFWGGMNIYLVSKSFKPLDNLIDKMQLATKGIYEQVQLATYDEFNILNDNFGQMVKKIEQREVDLQQSVKEKETLLRELYHRTKNNMQVISSLMMLYNGRYDSAEVTELLMKLRSKIESISLVHHKLYESENLTNVNLGEYIRDVIDPLVYGMSYDHGHLTYTVDMSGVYVLVDYAVPMGLVINELIINSLKYAFPEGRDGHILITGSIDYTNKRLKIFYRDNGVGFPEGQAIEASFNMGLTIVHNLVEEQLAGYIRFPSSKGFCCEIVFPLTSYSVRI